jgi:hypothetical protein
MASSQLSDVDIDKDEAFWKRWYDVVGDWSVGMWREDNRPESTERTRQVYGKFKDASDQELEKHGRSRFG